ncbi:hypothetical protein LTR62_003852 [Meristemomyces frigidus]|uniref:Uncharacterized protein n=1 Tax=Meristemomyces frigidus TaxID=1508187 RepID=A0AAN7YPF5_9PEZI|nr:hypothetical protein LTR62_003852 [Meristemomyces frigidus]
MADTYEYDGDEFDFDDNWLYVEDDFGLADELVESQIPDPGYSGTNHEIEADGFEYDYYEYWDDANYGDDAYWDYDTRQWSLTTSMVQAGQKRKRGGLVNTGMTDKRRKLSGRMQQASRASAMDAVEDVLYISQKERYARAARTPETLRSLKAYALLPDWRRRFAVTEVEVKAESMPEEMQKAAEAEEEEETLSDTGHMTTAGMVNDETGEEWEDEAEDNEAGAAAIGLDPETLKVVLRQKMADAGMSGMDEEAFMASISKMLSGEASEGDETAQLAEMLLGKTTGATSDVGVSKWLEEQGVELDNNEDDEASSVATAELPESATMTARVSAALLSPPGSTANGVPKEMALHSTPSKSHASSRPRKKVSFDVPSSGSEALDFAIHDELIGGTLPTPPTSSQNTAAANIAVIAAKAVQDKVANARAAKAATTPGAQLLSELTNDTEHTSVDVAGRTTRKRKAELHDPETEVLQGKGKRATTAPKTKHARGARNNRAT